MASVEQFKAMCKAPLGGDNLFAFEVEDINAYLEVSEIINYNEVAIKELAETLAEGTHNDVELARKVFEYVRDDVKHTFDIDGEEVTCKASEVLQHKHGLCYAKSHLLAALLRSLKIPTGFCYQRLTASEEDLSLVLHGLNAIYLDSLSKWVRVDARGNKEGVHTEFSTDVEKLAYSINNELGEEDEKVIYAKPSTKVLRALQLSKNVVELKENLPSEI